MIKNISVTSHVLDPPLSQTVTLSRTPSPSSLTYFMNGPKELDRSRGREHRPEGRLLQIRGLEIKKMRCLPSVWTRPVADPGGNPAMAPPSSLAIDFSLSPGEN